MLTGGNGTIRSDDNIAVCGYLGLPREFRLLNFLRPAFRQAPIHRPLPFCRIISCIFRPADRFFLET